MDNDPPIRRTMITCEICGTDFREGVEVVVYGRSHRFHNFACAINALAPRCVHCQRGIVERGPQSSGHSFCCDRCAGDHPNRTVAEIEPALSKTPRWAMHPPDHLPLLSVRNGQAQIIASVVVAPQPLHPTL